MPIRPHRIARRRAAFAAAALLASAAAGGAWLAGCAANDPFDPDSVPNQPPTARVFVAPIEPGGDLAPTSYYRARFAWSGTDSDGWIREYHVSLRTPADQDAPWTVTTTEDTVVTFATDETGVTDARLVVVCRDDRGALSDTASQYFSIRNFPPQIEYAADFNPLANMQREIVDPGGAAPDTVYWNYGVCNFRYNVYDPDGVETMDTHFRYTLVDGDPDVTWDEDDPEADPETGWVRSPLAATSSEQIRQFGVFLGGVAPGLRTLTVSVGDEALSDSRLQYTWEVREPAGRVLWVPDNASSAGRAFYTETLDAVYGAGGWSKLELPYGYPDSDAVLLGNLRLFDVVLWADGGATSTTLQKAAARNGVLETYVNQGHGSLLLISKVVTGNTSGLSPAFVQTVLKIDDDPAPTSVLRSFSGLAVLGEDDGMPSMTCQSSFAQAVGLAPLANPLPTLAAEALFRFEECCARGCFGSTRALVPCDPVVVTRWPLRSTGAPARAVAVGVQPEYFDRTQAIAVLEHLLTVELGVAAP